VHWCPGPLLFLQAFKGGLIMQDRKRKDQIRTIVGKCRSGKWRTIFGVKSEGGKCRTTFSTFWLDPKFVPPFSGPAFSTF